MLNLAQKLYYRPSIIVLFDDVAFAEKCYKSVALNKEQSKMGVCDVGVSIREAAISV